MLTQENDEPSIRILNQKYDLIFLHPRYPHGRCINIGPEMKETAEPIVKIFINISGKLEREDGFKVFFINPINGASIIQNQFSMKGDSIQLQTKPQGIYKKFKTKIAKFKHVKGDPKFDCETYDTNQTYSNCLEKELQMKFQNLLGCHPPLISSALEKMCNTTFNLSKSDKIVVKVLELVDNLFTNYHSTSCKTPCTYYHYDTRFLYSFPINSTENSVKLVMNKMVDITITSFMLRWAGLFTGIGGAISAGRTLFWFIISSLGVVRILKSITFNIK